MTTREVLARRIASNLAAVEMDLAGATVEGESDRVELLQTLSSCGADILLYRPQLQHYALLFGDIESSSRVTLMVPGVGDGTNLREEWIPEAHQLFDASPSTSVVLWKGYDNPVDVTRATAETVECDDDLVTAASELTAFVEWLELDPGQSLTVVAHGFGSVVTGAALADCGLQVTNVVVVGRPGLTADGLRDLHVEEAHLASEGAPGDVVGELGLFGVGSTSRTSGGMGPSTEAPDWSEVGAPWGAGEQGDEELGTTGTTARVVTGTDADRSQRPTEFPEVAGSLVAWTLRMPARPVQAAGRRYRGPGSRLVVRWCRLVDAGAAEAGHAVCLVLDGGERAVAWLARHVGALAERD